MMENLVERVDDLLFQLEQKNWNLDFGSPDDRGEVARAAIAAVFDWLADQDDPWISRADLRKRSLGLR